MLKDGHLGLGDVSESDTFGGGGDDTKRCMTALEAATRSFERLRNKFSVQMCSDLKRLMIYQKEFDRKMLVTEHGDSGSMATLGLSVHDTISVMLELGEEESAEKVRKELFVPDKRWWFLLMNAYTEQRQFDKLSTFIDRNR